MDELFSCRNCIHNCGQSLNIGRGTGFCLQHDSVILEPGRTTCKYLHRKDLPSFVVDEGVREHAAEFALFPRLVTLDTKESIERVRYSEKRGWENATFDPLTHALAQYHKSRPRWVFIQAFSAGADGHRSLAHASLARHYMAHCETWTSSYRLISALVEEIDDRPEFTEKSLLAANGNSLGEAADEALWDVVFSRLSAVQEYGWHAGLESLIWATDSVDGSLAELNWPGLQKELALLRQSWVDLIIRHAREHNVFFPEPPMDAEEGEE
jgi:hypothetical protein